MGLVLDQIPVKNKNKESRYPAMEIIVSDGDHLDSYFKRIDKKLYIVCGNDDCLKILEYSSASFDENGNLTGYTCDHCDSVVSFNSSVDESEIPV